jgi:hypothetical protein
MVGDDKLAPEDQVDQLERLRRVLETGVISNEQFEALKAGVVGRRLGSIRRWADVVSAIGSHQKIRQYAGSP